ncbi:MAG: right-handed parallel beta-helix repeat-containing protein [Oscillospiraceae bacterium]|nr:right-handed parallel beta-helix repeat-containing protein [Oscillospiraceae bacterium]
MDFIITEYGARQCDSMQTEAIQAALDACFLAGGGRVIVPKGVFYTGGLRLRSNTTLYLQAGAILRGSRDPADYYAYRDDKIEPLKEFVLPPKVKETGSTLPYSDWNSGLIKVISAKNIAIIGECGSYIDGMDCYNPNGEEGYRGPHAINIFDTENITLEGYTVMNSANWAHNIYCSQNITAKNLTVLGGHDGFDVRTCDNILIEDCEFRTGDDCVAGFDNKNVVVRNCIFECACSGMRFGGTDVLVENCQGFAHSGFGFRGMLTEDEKIYGVKTGPHCRRQMHQPFQYYCDFRADIRYTPGNIVIRNCRFEDPNAVFKHAFGHMWCCNRPLSSITYEDCEVLGLAVPGLLRSVAEEPLDFRLKNVKLTAREEGADFPILEASNCKYIEFDNVTIEGFRDPHIVTDKPDVVKIINGTAVKIVQPEKED